MDHSRSPRWSILIIAKRLLCNEGGARAAIFAYLSNIDHADCPKQSMLRVMTLEATKLTREEFASLLTVGNAHVRSPAPAIPAEHSARLIALGLHG